MNIGPKPPFTLQTAREKVKVLQALWNTRDPKAVSASIGPTFVRPIPFVPNPQPSNRYLVVKTEKASGYKFGWEEEFARLVRVFGFRLDYQARFDLMMVRDKSLKIKYLEEYHGEVKHFDDPIFKKTFDDYRSSKKKLWKRNLGLKALYFDDQGKVVEEFTLGTHVGIREEERLMNVPPQDLDNVVLPLVRLKYEFRDVGGKDEVWRVPEYEI
ncbi:aurofusarin biosynthesis cluster protein S [Physcia stellaris]|nr:aurofusarin biosynthesis cluster protein S [Physcia stellaris]